MAVCLDQRSMPAVYLTPLRVDHSRRLFHWPVYWRNGAWKDLEKGHVTDERQGVLARIVGLVRL